MNALDGQWGLIDVADCVAAARFLVAADRVDVNRIAIKGGSAGGLTVLLPYRAMTTFLRAHVDTELQT